MQISSGRGVRTSLGLDERLLISLHPDDVVAIRDELEAILPDASTENPDGFHALRLILGRLREAAVA